jgi:hypothetical protein
VKFTVQSWKGALKAVKEYPHVVLIQDNWDDYGYKTTFHAVLHLSADDQVDLGDIKILRKDQTKGFTELPKAPFEHLGKKYASTGGGPSYYETLYKQKKTIARAYLRGIRDVAFSDTIKADFEDHEGFRVSLLRFAGAERTLEDAAKLFKAPKPLPKKKSAGFRAKFKTSLSKGSNSFVIDFDFRRKGMLPNRTNVIIGYNGTGKTRLLSNLAVVASGYGYANKEDMLDRAAGRFIDSQPPFKTVVVVSYSAFDTFVIPGTNEIERKRLEDSVDLFGYVYCGLRERTEDSSAKKPTYRLKTLEEVEAEFLMALHRIRKSGRRDTFLEILKPLLRDPSFHRIGLSNLYVHATDDDEVVKLFRQLSSGHKSVLKIVAELTAYMSETDPTLVLLDEPETHLHPPLLTALLKSIRSCLDRFDGYAVIATHSPVVLQETPSRYVHVLRRVADSSKIGNLSIETFGESIGVITEDVFNLGDGTTDWHSTLDALAAQYDLERIEELFGRSLGFAARSYVLAATDDEDGE